MDVSSVVAELGATVGVQLRLAGDEPAFEAAGEALLNALEPAVNRAAMRLAEQAAVEVGAQLPDHNVEVVVSEGEPTLMVRSAREPVSYSGEDLAARITVRLPDELKRDLEMAARETGESVNTYVIKTLSATGSRSSTRSRQRFKGTIET